MSRRRFLFTIPLLGPLAIALVLPACSDDQLEAALVALGEGCLIDSDCEGELVCVFRRCHHECDTDKDCVSLGVGPYCRLGDRPTHVCLLDDERSCTTSAECPSANQTCSYDEVCRDRCSETGECLTGQSCLKGSCANEEEEGLEPSNPLLDPQVKGDEGEPCIYNSQCKSPLACIQGLCRVECLDDRDCPSNAACIVPPPEDVDIPDVAECIVKVTTTMPPTGPGPAHCSDGVTSGDETGVDCGGSCVLCPSGGGCSNGADCMSGVCTSGTCQAPTCNDGVLNGSELAVDCGGACPSGCPTGTDCASNGDCTAPDTCDPTQGICVAPTCSDGVTNDGETDVDCGGPNCGACSPSEGCLTPGDCTSLVCAAGTCLTAGCSDGVHNGMEADVDCGGTGSGCAPCGNGAMCTASSDCASGSCSGNLCVAASCSDGILNGTELGVDCGGPGCSAGCPLGTACNVDGDCDQTAPAGCHPTNLVCTALRTATVSVTGFGSGTVTSTPVGIACGSSCNTTVFDGDTIQLDATPGPNSTFASFSGDCTGTSPCMLTVSGADAAVTATFDVGTPGLANWTADPDYTSGLWAVDVDGNGQVFVAGTGGDFGCGLLTGGSDFSIAKYTPGPVQKADACVASFIDGGPSGQAIVDLVVDDNDDVVALFTAGGAFTLAGQPGPSICPNGTSNGFGIARYPGSLTLAAAQSTPCYGPAQLVAPYTGSGMERLPSGDLVVAGKISGTTGTDLGGPTTLFASNGQYFLTTYDGTTMSHVTTRQFGGTSEALEHLAVNPVNGDMVLSMACTDVVDFGNGVSTQASAGSGDLCVVELDASSNAQWVYQVGSATGAASGIASAFLPSGDVIVAGIFSGTVDFGDGVPHAAVGGSDIAIIHLDGTTGALKSTVPNSSWRAYGTPSADAPAEIAVVPSGPLAGTIYLAGHTCDTGGIDVGGGPLPANTSIFVAKYTSFGAHDWSTASTSPPVNCGNYDPVIDLAITTTGAPLALIYQAADWGSGPVSSNHLVRFNP